MHTNCYLFWNQIRYLKVALICKIRFISYYKIKNMNYNLYRNQEILEIIRYSKVAMICKIGSVSTQAVTPLFAAFPSTPVHMLLPLSLLAMVPCALLFLGESLPQIKK